VAGQPARRAGRVVRVEGDEDVGVGEAGFRGQDADLLFGGAEELDRVDALARGVQIPREDGGGARRGEDGGLGVRQCGG